MALNSLEMITSKGVINANIDKMISLKAQARNQAPFGVAIPLKNFSGALGDVAVFNVFKNKAEAAGFENNMLERLAAYVEKMVFKM